MGNHSNRMVTNLNNYKDKNGKFDEVKLNKLRADKPLLPPVTQEKFRGFSVKQNRDPYETFPDRLPTGDKMPLPVDEHEHIGMYENNQTLYLTTANAYNKLMKRIEELEKKVGK